MKIAKGTLKSHHVCVIRDSKYVTKDVKCYNSGSLNGLEVLFDYYGLEFQCYYFKREGSVSLSHFKEHWWRQKAFLLRVVVVVLARPNTR